MTKPGWAGVAAIAALFSFISVNPSQAEDHPDGGVAGVPDLDAGAATSGDLDAGVVADIDAGMDAVDSGMGGIAAGGSCALPPGAGGPVPAGARRISTLAEMTRIRDEDNYFERGGLTNMEYYGDVADLRYADGSTVRVSFTDRFPAPPIASVDCDTPRDELVPVETTTGLSVTSRAAMAAQAALHPETPPFTILSRIAVPVSVASSASGRTVPTHINNITAPFLCEQILRVRAEYIRQWDATAAATVRALESIQVVVELALLRASIPGAGGSSTGTITSRVITGGGGRVAAGLTEAAAETAFTGMRSGGGHAIRHLITEGIIPNSGPLATRVGLFRSLIMPILRSPIGRAFGWRVGATEATAYLGRVGSRWVVTFVANEGPYVGRIIGSQVPDATQLALMLGRAGFAGI